MKISTLEYGEIDIDGSGNFILSRNRYMVESMVVSNDVKMYFHNFVFSSVGKSFTQKLRVLADAAKFIFGK